VTAAQVARFESGNLPPRPAPQTQHHELHQDVLPEEESVAEDPIDRDKILLAKLKAS